MNSQNAESREASKSDVMSVRLHLPGVCSRDGSAGRQRGSSWNQLGSGRGAAIAGSTASRYRTGARKRDRDLELNGRRTTLVWRRRRFECGNCGERHLEDHAQFQAGLTRRFADRLVADATVMSIRAVGRHHGVGWHRIMGLVRAHSERVAQRRRTPPCRVLLVDETSIRRRHRYVTVVACGETGKILAMIPGRTKASLARFFRDQGAWWCRQVETVVPDGSRPYHPDHRTIPSRRSPCARQVPRRTLVHPRPHPPTTRDTTPRPRPASPNVRARPACEPASPSYAEPTT